MLKGRVNRNDNMAKGNRANKRNADVQHIRSATYNDSPGSNNAFSRESEHKMGRDIVENQHQNE
jgi:hypothetical protein